MKLKPCDSRHQRLGWAPGGYLCQCSQCSEQFEGDKRATMCADCAYDLPDPTPMPEAVSEPWTIERYAEELRKSEAQRVKDFQDHAAEVERLKACEATCHCGLTISQHGYSEGHLPVETQPLCPHAEQVIEYRDKTATLTAENAALREKLQCAEDERADLVKLLDCHPAYLRHQIIQLQSLVSELPSIDTHRQLQSDLTAARARCAELEGALNELVVTGLKGADDYRLCLLACKGDALTPEENEAAERFGKARKNAAALSTQAPEK